MRILHVLPELDLRRGGPPQALRVLARAQASAGSDVTVLPCRRSNGPQALTTGESNGLRVLAPVTEASLKWWSPAVRHAMLTASTGCDILHIHGTWRYHSRIAPFVARRSGAALVIRPYGNLGLAPRAHKGWVKSIYWRLFESRVATAACAIHCASSKEAEEIATLGLPTRTFIVPNPVDTSMTRHPSDPAALVRACPACEGDRPIVIYMGRISPIKNLPELIEAFSRVAGEAPDWHLVIAGNPEDVALAERIRARIRQLGLADRVSLPGMLVDGAKVALLRRASLFVQPSLHENFGISIAEALLFDLPCVVSDGVALATEIEQGGAGLRCEPRAEPLAAAMQRLMLDQDQRTQMAGRAGALAARFSPEAVATALEREYFRCLGR